MKKLIIIFLIPFVLASCVDNPIDKYELYPGLELNDVTWSNDPIDLSKTSALINDLVLDTKTLQLNSSTGATWNLNDKTQIILPANSYTNSSGGTHNGILFADVVVLNKKGDYIRNLLPSITATSIVEYGANSFFINLRSNVISEVNLASGKFITVNVKDTTAQSTQVLAFSETILPINNNNPVQWSVNGSWLNGSLQVVNSLPLTAYGSKKGFEIKTNKTGLNIATAKVYTPPSTTTRVDIVMPANFTNKNTIVFAVFDNKNIVLRLTPDPLSKSYYFKEMPTTEVVNFVSVSLIDNKIYYGSNKVTITPNGVYKLNPDVNPVTSTKLKTYLDLL
jgi:hypothetical protein